MYTPHTGWYSDFTGIVGESLTHAVCDPTKKGTVRESNTVIFKKHERITELGHIETAVLRNSGSLSLQRLTSLRRLGEAVTGTRTAPLSAAFVQS